MFGNKRTGVEAYRGSVNLKLKEIIDAYFELIFYGVLERYPKLRFVSVENEIGWMPFMLQQWDYYYNRFKRRILRRSVRIRANISKIKFSGRFSEIPSPVTIRTLGTGQLHVVQRLSAWQFNLAGFEKIYRPGSRPFAAGYPEKAGLHQRKKNLQHRHSAPDPIGVETVTRRARCGPEKSDGAPFF